MARLYRLPPSMSGSGARSARLIVAATTTLTVLTLIAFIAHGLCAVTDPPSHTAAPPFTLTIEDLLNASLPTTPCPSPPLPPPRSPPPPTTPTPTPTPTSTACFPCECPCASGPYLLQLGCEWFNEGIGSKFQRLKTALTLAAMTNLTLLSERACFTESHNQWDFADRYWMHRSLDCDACSVRQRPHHTIDLSHSPTQHWSEPTFHQAVCPPITPTLHARLLAGDQGILPPNVAGRDALYSIYSTLASTHPSTHPSLVFALPHRERSIEFLNACAAPVVRQRYELSFARQLAAGVRTPPPLDPALWHIGVHFRWGDTRRVDVEKPGQPRLLSPHHLPLRRLLHAQRWTPCADALSVHWFCSEGERTEFRALLTLQVWWVGGVQWRLGEGSGSDRSSDTLDDLDVLGHADVLVGGESSFFALASQFAHNATRVLVGRTLDSNGARNPKYQDHGTGFYAPMLTLRPFDLELFRAQLEALPQYARKSSTQPQN